MLCEKLVAMWASEIIDALGVDSIKMNNIYKHHLNPMRGRAQKHGVNWTYILYYNIAVEQYA